MAQIKVHTKSGSEYTFKPGTTAGEIRQRIRSLDIEAKALGLKDEDIEIDDHHNQDAGSGDVDVKVYSAHYSRYPAIIHLLLPPPPGEEKAKSLLFILLWAIIGSFWIAAWAQVSFDLPAKWAEICDAGNSPVPITFQTFAIMVLGSLVGWKASLGAGVWYCAMIAMGAPFAAQENGGWEVLAYGSGGYFIGFLIALFQIGYMAERGWDRQIWRLLVIMTLGNVIIYVCGLIWLPFGLGFKYSHPNQPDLIVCGGPNGCVGNTLNWGLTPFIPGDAIKIILATIVLKCVWMGVAWFSSRKDYVAIEMQDQTSV